MKDSFIFYTSYAEKFKRLSDLQFGQFVRALVSYQLTGEEPEIPDTIVGTAFDVAKVELDAANAKYYEICEQRRQAGRIGGQANASKRKQTQANASKSKQAEANPTYNDNDNENVNYIYRDRENAHAREETDREILERTFREFWDEYPKKQNESAACRAWISLAPSPELAAEIIKAVKENKKRNAEWKRNGGRYIPKAENWLFDQRWRDEISEEKDEEADKGKAAGDDYYNDEFFEKFVERKRAERKKREEELKNGTSTNEGNVGRAE